MKKKTDAKEKILHESIKLFLSKGFSGSTTNELVRLAGVSKGTLYWHFKNKDDILRNILDKYCDEFINETIRKTNSCTGDFVTKFKEFYRFNSEFALDNKYLLLVFSSLLMEFTGTGHVLEKRMKNINNQYILIIQKLIEDGIKDGTVRKMIDPVIYSRLIASFLMGSLHQWFIHFSSYEDDPFLNKQHAIIQRDELLKILMMENSHLPVKSTVY